MIFVICSCSKVVAEVAKKSLKVEVVEDSIPALNVEGNFGRLRENEKVSSSLKELSSSNNAAAVSFFGFNLLCSFSLSSCSFFFCKILCSSI